MGKLNSKPFLASSLAILLVILLHKLPLDSLLYKEGIDRYVSEAYGKAIVNIFCILGISFYIIKMGIPFKLHVANSRNFKYYLPLLFYVIVFSGGFRDFRNFDFISVSLNTFSSYTLKYLSSSFLEEFLFRGLILGLFIAKYSKYKNGILKSVIFSGCIFGIMHVINFWTIEGATLEGVFNQVYATTCFGVMYGATYLKTKSILMLSIIHFLSNFFASINELKVNDEFNYLNTLEAEKALIAVVVGEMLRLLIFGIPLIIGLYLIQRTNRMDLKKLLGVKEGCVN